MTCGKQKRWSLNTPSHARGVVRAGLILLAVLMIEFRVWSADEVNNLTATQEAVSEQRSSVDFANFFDVEVRDRLKHLRIPGAAIAVVSSREVLFMKGFGTRSADPSSPEVTLETSFRWGSVSKVLVGLAVMQQVRAGKLGLDDDLRERLGLTERVRYPYPITLAGLLTHTAGLDGRSVGLFVTGRVDVPLLAALVAETPRQVRPPGEAPAYSNEGTALAARVVELTSGLSWEEYAQERVFRPLNMRCSTFVQASVVAGCGGSATGTSQEGRPLVYAFVRPEPAGSLSSSIADMAKFAQSLLPLAESGWSAEAQAMREVRYRTSPASLGLGLGLVELSVGGEFIVGHGGSMPGHHALLAVFPRRDLSLVVAFNGDRGAELRDELLERFARTLGSSQETRLGKKRETQGCVGGHYIPTKLGTTGVHRLLWMREEQVLRRQDGTWTWGREELTNAFSCTANGGQVALDRPATYVYERISWWNHRMIRLGFFGVSWLIWMVGVVRVRRYLLGQAKFTLLATFSFLSLAHVAGALVAVFRTDWTFGIPLVLRASPTVQSVVTLMVALGVIPTAYQTWRRHSGSRAAWGFVTVGGLGTTLSLWMLGLLGWPGG